MHIIERTCSAIAANAAGLAAAQAPTNGTKLTLTASPVLLSPPRRISIVSAANDMSGFAFTVVGTDRFGNALTEVITGPGAGLTVTGNSIFASVTSITPTGTNGGNLTVGWSTESISAWVFLGNFKGHYTWRARCFIAPGQVSNYDLEVTSDWLPKNHDQSTGEAPDDIEIITAAPQTVNFTLLSQYPCVGIRLKVHSGGPVTLRIIPSRTA